MLWIQVQSHTGPEYLGRHGIQDGVGAIGVFCRAAHGSLARLNVMMM